MGENNEKLFKSSLFALARGIDINTMRNLQDATNKFMDRQLELVLDTEFTNEQIQILLNFVEQGNKLIDEMINKNERI